MVMKIISEFMLSYCQAVLKRMKPSHKTTSSNHTVYRFMNSQIFRTLRCKIFKMRFTVQGLKGEVCRDISQAVKRKEGGKGKERWDARQDRYSRGRTVTHKMAIRR